MVNKYFISCVLQDRQIGAMQFESKSGEYQKKSEALCPEKAMFRAYIIKKFEENMPIDEFISASKMKELGY